MADDFKELIAEQRKTTMQLMTAEEQAEYERKLNEQRYEEGKKDAKRQEAGRKAYQTRLENQKNKKGGAAAKEEEDKKKSADKKGNNLLKAIGGGITGIGEAIKDKAKGAKKGIKAMLKGTLIAGALVAVLAFLNSKYWTDTKKFIVDEIVPRLVRFYKNTIKPFAKAIMGFIKNPTWDNFKNIFSVKGAGSLVAGLAGIVLLLKPKLLFTALKLGIGAFKLAFNLIGKAFGLKGSIGKSLGKGLLKGLKGGIGFLSKGFGALGTALKKMKLPKAPKVNPKQLANVAKNVAGNAGKAIASTAGNVKTGAKAVGKALLSGAGKFARFLGPVGVAVAAGAAIYNGIDEGMEAYRKTGKLSEGVKTGAAAALKTLTFGLISTQTFKKGFDYIQDKTTALIDGTTDLAKKAWSGVKSLVPTKETITKAYTSMKDNALAVTETVGNFATKAWSGVKSLLPTKKTITAAYTSMKDNALAVTDKVGDLASKAWTGVKDTLKNVGTNLSKKFTDLTGLKIPDLATVGANLKSKFTELTGLEVPSFADVKTKVKDLGKRLGDKFSGIMDTAKGFFTSTTKWFSGLFSSGDPAKKKAREEAKKKREGLKDAVKGGVISKKERQQIIIYERELRDFKAMMGKKYKTDEEMMKAFNEAMKGTGPMGRAFGMKLRSSFGDRKNPYGKGKVTDAQLEKLHKQNMQFNKKALEKGSIFTHDQGLHDRVDALMNAFFPKGSTPDLVSKTSPNLISPSGTGGAANAQRTAAMQNAMIQKRLDETGGMGSQAVIAPTNVSNSESTNITQTTMSIINPDQIISVINRAA